MHGRCKEEREGKRDGGRDGGREGGMDGGRVGEGEREREGGKDAEIRDRETGKKGRISKAWKDAGPCDDRYGGLGYSLACTLVHVQDFECVCVCA